MTGGTAAVPMSGDPLTSEHLTALQAGRKRFRRIRRAAGFATFSGVSMAIFAGFSLLAGLFGDVLSLVTGAALGVVAVIELRGAARLRRLDLGAPAMLGWNQIGLGAVLVAYGGWQLAVVLTSSDIDLVGGQTTGDADMDAMVAGLRRTISIAVYGTIVAVGFIVPVLTARYYFSRRRHLEAATAETPDWVIRAIQATG